MSREDKLVRCSNCDSIFLLRDFRSHTCMDLRGDRGLVEIKEDIRYPVDYIPEVDK